MRINLLQILSFLSKNLRPIRGVGTIQQIVEIVRDTIQHTTRSGLAIRDHDLRRLLLPVRLFTLRSVGDVGDDVHVFPALQFRHRQQLDVVLHGQRHVWHPAQSRLNVRAAQNLRRALRRRIVRDEDLPLRLPVFTEFTKAAALVAAVALVHAVQRGPRREHAVEHDRFLVLSRAGAVVLQIYVVRVIDPDLRQESAGDRDGGVRVRGRGLVHELAHVYAARCDPTCLQVRLTDAQRRRRRGSVVLHLGAAL